MKSLEDLMRGRGMVPSDEGGIQFHEGMGTNPYKKPETSKKSAQSRAEIEPVAESKKHRRLIAEPGIYELSEEDYHADCCPEPSLSASIAKKLVGQSPAHARHAHPRLNPGFAREEKEIFDRGTVAHALLLQGIEAAVVLDFDNWRTKEAKAKRDTVRAQGKIPILRDYWDAVVAMVDSCRAQLAQHKEASDAFTNGKPEQTLIWREDNGVWCRARLDWLHDSRRIVDDYKSTGREVDPDSIARHCLNDWEVQAAFYRRGIMKLFRENAQFRFIAQENQEPYAINVVELGSDFVWLGDEKVEYAIRTFGNCLKHGRWPGYSDRVHCVQKIPKWAEDSWLQKGHGA